MRMEVGDICEHLLKEDGERKSKRALDEEDSSALLMLRDAMTQRFPRKKDTLQLIFQRKRWVETTALELNMDNGEAKKQLLDRGFQQCDVDMFKQLGEITLERVKQSSALPPPQKRPKCAVAAGIDEQEERMHMLVDLHCEIERKCALANKAMQALKQSQQEVNGMMQEILRLLADEAETPKRDYASHLERIIQAASML